MLVDVITAYVDGATAEGYSEDWDLEKLWAALKTLYPVGIDHHDLIDSDAVGEPGELTREELLDALIEDAERAYAQREKQLEELAGEGAMRQLERNVLLNVIDRKWREHLYEMDYLKEGIGLRAMAQRDPLVEYQREGFDMFIGMLDAMKEESVGFLFNVTVEAAPAAPAAQVAPVAAPDRAGRVRRGGRGAGRRRQAGDRRADGPAPASGRGTRHRRCAPRELTTSARADLHRPVRGRLRAGAAPRRRRRSGGRPRRRVDRAGASVARRPATGRKAAQGLTRRGPIAAVRRSSAASSAGGLDVAG